MMNGGGYGQRQRNNSSPGYNIGYPSSYGAGAQQQFYAPVGYGYSGQYAEYGEYAGYPPQAYAPQGYAYGYYPVVAKGGCSPMCGRLGWIDSFFLFSALFLVDSLFSSPEHTYHFLPGGLVDMGMGYSNGAGGSMPGQGYPAHASDSRAAARDRNGQYES